MTQTRPAAFCRICGRALSAKRSVEYGIGPDCAAKSQEMAAASRQQDQGPIFLHDEGLDIRLCRIEGRPAMNVIQREIMHSPTGMEWGYAGSGAADLAYNILLIFTNRDRAWHLHQEFKFAFVAELPEEGGTIKAADVRAWLAKQDAENPMAPYFRAPAARDERGKKKARPRRKKKRAGYGQGYLFG